MLGVKIPEQVSLHMSCQNQVRFELAYGAILMELSTVSLGIAAGYQFLIQLTDEQNVAKRKPHGCAEDV